MTRVPRIVAVVDSDSYLKWAAATLTQLNIGSATTYETQIVIARSPIAPSAAQIDAATLGTPWHGKELPVLTPRGIGRMLRDTTPDAMLLAATGPVVEWVADMALELPVPPVLLSGIPGMALPARRKGLNFRKRIHAWIVHSHRERTEYQALLDDQLQECRLVLSRLPFLPQATLGGDEQASLSQLVFTTQAKVPASRHQREQILKALHDVSRNHPEVNVVVKVRAFSGEQQTHNEKFAYDVLWQDLCASDEALHPSAVTFAGGALSDFLTPGTAHVTVSSTAAFESLALGLPTAIISDFGVNERLLNAVFLDSGCVLSLEEISDLTFPVPPPVWQQQNYLHDDASELPGALAALLAQRANGDLVQAPRDMSRKARQRILRSIARCAVPPRAMDTWRGTRAALRRRPVKV